MNLEYLLSKVKNIVKQSSKLCLKAFEIELKDGESNIVTSTDKAIQNFLDVKLKKLIPESKFFQEEQEQNEVGAKYLWIIDPIDGTENFSRGIKDFAISIALAIDGEIVLGVCYLPKTKELFSAIKNGGAFLNNKPIHVSYRKFEQSLFATAFSLYKKEYAGVCQNILKEAYPIVKDFRRFGSCACELCYIAKGELDLLFEIRVFLWDFAAALLILKEAGGYACALMKNDISLQLKTPIIAANSKENLDNLAKIVDKYTKGEKYE